MNTPWQIVILDALEALDQKEGPHGLYGIRQAHSSSGRLPKLAHLLGSPGKLIIMAEDGGTDTGEISALPFTYGLR